MSVPLDQESVWDSTDDEHVKIANSSNQFQNFHLTKFSGTTTNNNNNISSSSKDKEICFGERSTSYRIDANECFSNNDNNNSLPVLSAVYSDHEQCLNNSEIKQEFNNDKEKCSNHPVTETNENRCQHSCDHHFHHNNFNRKNCRNSWNYSLRSSQIEFLPIPDAKMEPITRTAHIRVHRVLREGFLAIGIFFTSLGLCIIELIRVLTLTLLHPFLNLFRFISHLLINFFCDIGYLICMRFGLLVYPIIEVCSDCSKETILPIAHAFRPIQIHYSGEDKRIITC